MAELQKREQLKQASTISPPKRTLSPVSDELISISPLKLGSSKKHRQYEDGPSTSSLLPSIVLHSDSPPGACQSSHAPEFNTWRNKESMYYSQLREHAGPGQSSSSKPKCSSQHRKDSDESPVCERSASPLNWSPSPPARTKKSGKRKAQDVDWKTPEPLAPAQEGDAPDDGDKGLQMETPSKATTSSFEAALAKKGVTLAKALDKSVVSSPSKQQYLADVSGHQVTSLPETCEVNSKDIQDILLEEDYTDLPNLIAGSFRSWSHAVGNGFVLFSGWATQLPDLDINCAFTASVYTSNDNSKSVLHADQRVAVCLSSILVIDSQLLIPTDRGLRNKFIKGTLHEQEMQRFVGATCMAFGHEPVLHAQIERDSMVFSTLGDWKAADSRSGTASGANFIRGGLLSKSLQKSHGGFTKHVLDVHDTVSVYDARGHLVDFDKELDQIDTILPRYGGEVPPGSFAVMAYTITTFRKNGNWHLSTNVQFVIVIKDFEA